MKLNPHKNNFNLLRLIFAILVVFSHSYALLGHEEPTLYGRSLGNLSVHGFFVISGYLICKSWLRNPTVLSFSFNRILRIVPGLVVAMIITRYVANICGRFQFNPVPYISNGPVWTLTWEVVCYCMVAVLGTIRTLNISGFPCLFCSAWLLFLSNISSTSTAYVIIAPLVLMFLAGSFIAVMEKNIDFSRVPYASILGLAIITYWDVFYKIYGWVTSNVPFLWGPAITAENVYLVVYLVAFPLFVVWIGRSEKAILNIQNDLSYGIYIYGWPVAQSLVFFAIKSGLHMAPFVYFALTMLIVLPLSFASWKIIEKPSLSLKKLFSVMS